MNDARRLSGTEGSARWEPREDGIVILTLDGPTTRTNMVTDAHVAGMAAFLDTVEQSRERVQGVVVTSAKESFFSGPEFDSAAPMSSGNPYGHVREVRDQLRRLELLGRPVAAAMVGSALGGGVEIALAAHHRVGLDRGDVRWALSERTMGILPGGGGTVRIARTFGAATTMREIIGAGVAYTPRMALARGIVDELAPTRDAVVEAAVRWVRNARPGDEVPRWERADFVIHGGGPGDPEFDAELDELGTEVADQRIAAYRSLPEILSVTVAALTEPVDVAFESETAAFLRLVADPAARELGRSFQGFKRIRDRLEAARGARRPVPAGTRTLTARNWNPLADIFVPDAPNRVVEVPVPAGATENELATATADAAVLGIPILVRPAGDAPPLDALDAAVREALLGR